MWEINSHPMPRTLEQGDLLILPLAKTKGCPLKHLVSIPDLTLLPLTICASLLFKQPFTTTESEKFFLLTHKYCSHACSNWLFYIVFTGSGVSLIRYSWTEKKSKYKSYRNNISDGIALVSILKIATKKAFISSSHNVAKEPKYSFAFV